MAGVAGNRTPNILAGVADNYQSNCTSTNLFGSSIE